VLVVPSIFLLRVASRPWLADLAASHRTLSGLKRAAEIEPRNAERYYELGRYESLMGGDAAPDAIGEFRTATELNPHRGRYWIELARALRSQGDLSGEGTALHEAIRQDPANVNLADDAAAFFLARGDIDDAIREFRLVIEHDEKKAPTVYATLWRQTHDADLLISRGVPPSAQYHAALMKVLLRADQSQAADELWRRWMSLSGDMTASPAFPYIDFLIARGEYTTAKRAWDELTTHSAEIRARLQRGNLLLNGDFEDPIMDGGFEWRYRRTPMASLSIDTERFHTGSAGLRIDFTGKPGEDVGIGQFVVVPPNTTLKFRGFIRAEEVFTTHGPRFTITDVATGAPLYQSAESTGTTLWVERQGAIAASPTTRLLAVRVTREPEGHITGRVWIDDLSLTAGDSQ
jgi:tetratricopeptide (TPR) repeat protein